MTHCDPYLQAIREHVPPPGYRIGNRETDAAREPYRVLVGGPLFYFVIPSGVQTEVPGGRTVYENLREACLAAWAHFDEQHPMRCLDNFTSGDEIAQCALEAGHDGAHDYNFTREPLRTRVGWPPKEST